MPNSAFSERLPILQPKTRVLTCASKFERILVVPMERLFASMKHVVLTGQCCSSFLVENVFACEKTRNYFIIQLEFLLCNRPALTFFRFLYFSHFWHSGSQHFLCSLRWTWQHAQYAREREREMFTMCGFFLNFIWARPFEKNYELVTQCRPVREGVSTLGV